MDKKLQGTVIFYACLIASAATTYFAFDYNFGLAASGKQPSLLVGVGSFFLAVGFVIAGIIAKAKWR